jgi:hypothetical protein
VKTKNYMLKLKEDDMYCILDGLSLLSDFIYLEEKRRRYIDSAIHVDRKSDVNSKRIEKIKDIVWNELSNKSDFDFRKAKGCLKRVYVNENLEGEG